MTATFYAFEESFFEKFVNFIQELDSQDYRHNYSLKIKADGEKISTFINFKINGVDFSVNIGENLKVKIDEVFLTKKYLIITYNNYNKTIFF